MLFNGLAVLTSSTTQIRISDIERLLVYGAGPDECTEAAGQTAELRKQVDLPTLGQVAHLFLPGDQ